MANTAALNLLYYKQKSPLEFKFDSLTAPPLLTLLSVNDIKNLHDIATDITLSGKTNTKYKLIDQIMRSRGFVKMHAGTNRVVYRFLEDQRFIVKVAVDSVALKDNPAEFENQRLLKPFVTKVFEVSPCGTVGLFERVNPVLSREEYSSIADDVYYLITKFLVGKYVLEDFGTKYFMNIGVRPGYGPVLLDFPYVYELDGNKLYCNANPIKGRKDIVCGGEIDYDDGFNTLICTKCGRRYNARDLEKKSKNKLIILKGDKKMKVKVTWGDRVMVNTFEDQQVSTTLPVEEKVSAQVEPTIVEDTNNTKPTETVENDSEELLLIKKSDAINLARKAGETVYERKNGTWVKPEDEVVTKDKPKDSIFNNGETNFAKSMADKVNKAIEEAEPNDDDLYADYEDYYLDNNYRSNRKGKKKPRKNDFEGF